MAATAAGVRYAPPDPSLPKPWKGLVDGNTGYLYFWNPETNVTQYERPVVSFDLKSSEAQKSPSPPGYENNDRDDDPGNNHGSPNVISGSENNQAEKTSPEHSPADDSDTKGNIGSAVHASKGVESGLSPASYRRQHEIAVIGDNIPPPMTSFGTKDFPVEILREIQHAGFSSPTPIQAQSWPIAMQGRDIVAVAKTGSGKTLGYMIPGFIHLQKKCNNPRLGPTVLVLSPTRELATQIQDEAVKFGKSSRISCTCLYGGASKGPQLRDLDKGVDIVVATPGRLNDILEMRRVSLHQVSYLVLDEADRMLDMGFEPQIRKIVKDMPSRRQTLMYTATWPKEVRKIAADLLNNPVQVNIGNVDELVANKSITQHVELLSHMDKRRRLEQILRSQEPGSKIIIFCSTKRMCDQLAGNLAHQFGAAAIHGDKCQDERDHVLNQFRTGRSPVLVATDVAARGLDIKDIKVVINYDFPTGVEDYVHRIGRTGRAGATGVSYTFFGDQDARYASDLVKVLEGANQSVPSEIREMASRGGGGGGMNRPRRQWSSGDGASFGGRFNSSYTARDGGSGAGAYGNEQRDSSNVGPGNDTSNFGGGGAPYKRFHESMTSSGTQSRTPAWSENQTTRARSRSRSRSPNKFDTAPPPRKSFHESMMERDRSPTTKNW